VLVRQGRAREALPLLERALAIREATIGADHVETGTSHNNLASALIEVGELDAARTHLERTLVIYRAALGERHPDLGIALSNLGEIALRQRRWAVAAERCREALAIEAANLPEDHPDLAWDLTCEGEALLGLGRRREATAALERAVALRAGTGAASDRARSQFALARALTGGRRAPARALALAQDARAGYAGAGDDQATARGEVEAWLAAHGGD
jgi:tetratricopeptide (TPR) repeat protein